MVKSLNMEKVIVLDFCNGFTTIVDIPDKYVDKEEDYLFNVLDPIFRSSDCSWMIFSENKLTHINKNIFDEPCSLTY